MNQYRHTQPGYLVVVIIVAMLIIIGVIIALGGFSWIALAVIVIVALVLIEFSSLTVTITKDMLEARFGPGPIRKRILLSDIESSQTVRNHWYYGWGIRKIRGGWLFNVSGLDTVELVMHNGSRYRIGTDMPQVLAGFIQKRLNTPSIVNCTGRYMMRSSSNRYLFL